MAAAYLISFDCAELGEVIYLTPERSRLMTNYLPLDESLPKLLATFVASFHLALGIFKLA
jgi:hypothetical protein